MAEDKKSSNGNVCMCAGCRGGMMGGGRHWTFFLLRTLLTILILMIVFWFGVQVGKMNSEFGRGLMMTRTGYARMGVNPGGPMIPVGATSTP